MNFVKGLPKSQKHDVVFVVVDKLTKFVHFIPLSHPYTAAKVASLFMQHIFKLHGMPTSIISDRDPIFTSKFYEELLDCMGLSWPCYLPITLNLMVRQKWSIKALSSV